MKTHSLAIIAFAALAPSQALAQASLAWTETYDVPLRQERPVAMLPASNGETVSILVTYPGWNDVEADGVTLRRLSANGDLLSQTELSVQMPMCIQGPQAHLRSVPSLESAFLDAAGRVVCMIDTADGAKLLAVARDGTVELELPLLAASAGSVSSSSYVRPLPDGDYLAAVHDGIQSSVYRVENSGAIVWRSDVPGRLATMAVGNADEIYVLPRPIGAPRTLHRLNGQGQVLWSRTQPFSLNDISAIPLIRPDGSILVTGNTRLRLTSSDGVIQWVKGTGFDVGIGVLDAQGELFAYGRRSFPRLIARFDLAGDLVWEREVLPGGSVDVTNLSLTDEGHVIVSGDELSSNTGVFTRAFSGAGDVLWDADYSGLSQRFERVNFGSHVINSFGDVVAAVSAVPDVITPFGYWLNQLAETILWIPGDDIGDVTCVGAEPNSTGLVGRIIAAGSDVLAENNLTLITLQLPPQSTVLLLTSLTVFFDPNPGGSQGWLCVGGQVGRFLGPTQVRETSDDGRASLRIDLGALPQPNGPVQGVQGETWHFQVWHRDANPQATSNFTGAVNVTLR